MSNPRSASAIRKRLEDRAGELRSDILRELQKYDDDRYSLLADRVADPGDQSISSLLSDIDLSEISRDVEEYREIDAALIRLANGSYGTCIDCEEVIPRERLDVNPAAARCVRCQKAFESQDREIHIRTI